MAPLLFFPLSHPLLLLLAESLHCLFFPLFIKASLPSPWSRLSLSQQLIETIITTWTNQIENKPQENHFFFPRKLFIKKLLTFARDFIPFLIPILTTSSFSSRYPMSKVSSSISPYSSACSSACPIYCCALNRWRVRAVPGEMVCGLVVMPKMWLAMKGKGIWWIEIGSYFPWSDMYVCCRTWYSLLAVCCRLCCWLSWCSIYIKRIWKVAYLFGVRTIFKTRVLTESTSKETLPPIHWRS